MNRIKEKMDACGALLVLGGVYPLYQDWISKEIMACKSEGDKPLIVVIRDSSLSVYSRREAVRGPTY